VIDLVSGEAVRPKRLDADSFDVSMIRESAEELNCKLQAHLKLLESYAGGNRDV